MGPEERTRKYAVEKRVLFHFGTETGGAPDRPLYFQEK
jgi:hypothetical protein